MLYLPFAVQRQGWSHFHCSVRGGLYVGLTNQRAEGTCLAVTGERSVIPVMIKLVKFNLAHIRIPPEAHVLCSAKIYGNLYRQVDHKAETKW